MPFAAMQIDLELFVLSEVSQKNINTIWHHLYVESKNDTKNLFIKQKEIHRKRKQNHGYQRGKAGRDK